MKDIEENKINSEDQEDQEDSKIDAIAATLLILTLSAAVVFWVANQ